MLKTANTEELKNKCLNKVIYFLWGSLVFLMFALPVNVQIIKALLLGLIIVLSFVSNGLKAHFNKKLAWFFLFWMCFSTLASVLGFLKNNSGAFSFFKVNFIYFLLLFFAIINLKTEKAYLATVKAIYFANIFISIYTFYLLLYQFGFSFGGSLIVLDDTSGVGLHDGYTHITNTNLSMTIFTFPFLIMLYKPLTKSGVFKKSFLLLNITLTAFAMFLSGRRILWLVLAVSLPFFFFKSDLKLSKKVSIMCFGLVATITFIVLFGNYLSISISGLSARFLEAFSKTDEYGNNNVRLEQMEKLFQSFLQNPLLGSGGGATINGYSRNAKLPWAFEATYHVILFNSGIIGSLFFFLAIVTIFSAIFKIHHPFKHSAFLSFAVALAASATNPYISASFDFWLFLFIPVLFVNCYGSNKKIAKNDSNYSFIPNQVLTKRNSL